MTALASAIGALAMLAALAGAVLLDLAREAPVGAATDRRAIGSLLVGLLLVGAVCTVIRMGRLA